MLNYTKKSFRGYTVDKKVVLITGASSGIGLASAKLLHNAGYKVYALVRNPNEESGIEFISTDITKAEQVDSAFEQVIAKEGKVDILINNAGMGIYGSTENTDLDKARYLFDINFFAAVSLAQKVVPYMRATGGGRIINISSLAQVFCLPFQSFYSASKAALSAVFSAFSAEVKPFNIKVTNIMPGDIATNFTANRQKDTRDLEIYSTRLEKNLSVIEKDELGGMEPKRIAKAILREIKAKRPKTFVTIGAKYKLFYVLAKILPASFVNKIVYLLYASE